MAGVWLWRWRHPADREPPSRPPASLGWLSVFALASLGFGVLGLLQLADLL
jgi:hypothetical protein